MSEAPRIRPVPGARPEILGLTEWRGRILSVLDLPLLIDAASDGTPGCLLRLAPPFQYCALYLPASVRLERDDRDPEPPTGERSRRPSPEPTLIRVDTLMSRVGVGKRVAS